MRGYCFFSVRFKLKPTLNLLYGVAFAKKMARKLYSTDFQRGGDEGMISPIYQAILASGIKQSDLDRSLQRTAPPAIIQNNDFTKHKSLSRSFETQTRILKRQSRLLHSETRRNNDYRNMGNFWRLTQRYKYLRALELAEWSAANPGQQPETSLAETSSDNWSSHLKGSSSESAAQPPLTETTKVAAANSPSSLVDGSTHGGGDAVKDFFEVFSPGGYSQSAAAAVRPLSAQHLISLAGLFPSRPLSLLLFRSVDSSSRRHGPREQEDCTSPGTRRRVIIVLRRRCCSLAESSRRSVSCGRVEAGRPLASQQGFRSPRQASQQRDR